MRSSLHSPPNNVSRLVRATGVFIAGLALALSVSTSTSVAHAQSKKDDANKGSLIDDNDGGNTPFPDLLKEAETKINEIQAILVMAEQKLKDARDAKDALAIECVAEQVANIKGLLKLSQKAQGKLTSAVTANDESKARSAMRRINATSARAATAGSEARLCLGAGSVETATDVDVEVDDSIGSSDPYYSDNGQFSDPSSNVVDGTGTTNVGSDGNSVNPPPPPTTGFQ